MKRTLADLNVDAELAEGVHLKSTEQTYVFWKNKFLRFCDLGGAPATVETYSDRNIAAWLLVLCEEYERKPHAKKSAIAALNAELRVLGLKLRF